MILDLRCNAAINPLGMDDPSPRLSWMPGADQVACRVRVASTPDMLPEGFADVWDSGFVASSLPWLDYGGRAPVSRERFWWTVETHDRSGCLAQASAPAWFEYGLLQASDWKAGWVGRPGGWSGQALLFQRAFEVRQPVRTARLYAAGLGYRELRVNGEKIGDEVLEPAPTAYHRRVLYSTHDVTPLLRPGVNRIGAIVGNGHYGVPKLLIQLEITQADGVVQSVATGPDAYCQWRVARSPVTRNDIYDGETCDARLERPGWDTPEGPELAVADRLDGWCWAMAVEPPGGMLAARQAEPIRVVETLRPVSVAPLATGGYVFDLGRNIAGWARIRVRGPRGAVVRLRFAESLHPDGSVNQENLRTARAEDIYILKGEGPETWEPRFTYHGFRYIQMDGWPLPDPPSVDDLEGRVVRSDVPARGTFECDHPGIMAIHQAVCRTESSNLHGIPTDCPQRDERLGWLNDITARAEESIHNFDLRRFYSKWLDDVVDAQDSRSGALPDTIPLRFGHQPCDPVCMGLLLVPWLLYCHAGEDRLLRRHFPAMRRWVDCLASMRAADGTLSYSLWGDWAPPVRIGPQAEHGDSPWNAGAPGPVVSTAFLYLHADLLARIGMVLGEHEVATQYRALADQVSAVFQARFWNPDVGGYGTGSQSCNALALYAGLVPREVRKSLVVESLVRDIERYDGHLTTGNICTKYLLEALTAAGRTEVAWRVVTAEGYPGWNYMLANGATTLWERWELATGGAMNSHNHPMLASVGAWFYRALAGLRVEEWQAGLRLHVCPPPPLPGLNRAAATLPTATGNAAVAWSRAGGRMELSVTVPSGGRAEVFLPQGEVRLDGRVRRAGDGGQPELRMASPGLRVPVASGTFLFSVDEKRNGGDDDLETA